MYLQSTIHLIKVRELANNGRSFFSTTKLLVAARTIGTVATEFTIFLPLLRMKIDEMNKVTKW